MALTKIPASLLDTTGGLDLQGNITLGDSEQIQLGADSDLLIYHSGAHSFITDSGTGALRIQASDLGLETSAGNQNYLTGVDGGAVTIYHNGSPKIATSSTGATVTGNLAVTGDLDITGNVNSASVTDLDVTDKTITLGAGQTEALSGGSGIIIDGSNASILWDETNSEWDFNKVLKLTTPSTTTASITAEETGGATIRMAAGGSSAFIGTMSNHYLRFLVNSQERASLTANGDFTVTNDFKLTTTNPRIDYDNNGSGALRFYSMSAAQERARITSSGKMIIGDVNTDTTDALQIQSPASGGGYGIQLRRDDSNADQQMGRILFGNNTNNDLAQIAAKTDGSTDNSAIFFSTRPTSGSLTERMYIDSDGNVGIGETSPAYSLDFAVGNTIRLRHTTAGSAIRVGASDYDVNLIRFDGATGITDNGYYGGALRYMGSRASNNNSLSIFMDNSTGTEVEAMTILQNGNIGIGTGSSVDQKLHVNSGGTNVVARFESTDNIAGIMLKDNTGNVELETYGGAFRVNPGGLSSPISFSSGVDSNYFTTNTVHSGTNQDFDFTILNSTTSNYGPRVRIYGGGQSSAASADVPWDNQQGYNTGSLWFDSGEGPSIYGAGIAGYAEEDFNTNDTPAALAFYTTPNNTGGQTNTAKERLRIRADGTAHLSPTESNTHLYLGSAGGLTGGNNSINVRAAGNNMMLNSVGQLIVERTGIQKFLVDETYSKVTTNGSDGYNLRVESSGAGDPGLSMWRAGQAGFGINVRTATTNYADFMVNTGGEPAYNPGGTTNAPIRIYQDNNVSIPHSAVWSSGIGNTFSPTGNHYMIRNSNSTGNESIIVNNTLSGGAIGILQYRITGGVQGQYLIGQSGSGITFTGSSDYRLKENVSTITESSLDKINQLRLVSYNWNDLSDMPTDTTEIGVIAHEIEEVFPEFVDGEKDAVYTQEELDARGDPETTNEEVGDIKPQTVSLVNKDMIVHILKAMQELKAENDALRTRIEVLESN